MNDPTAEQVRVAIVKQLCPWCGKGPYKVVAIHTSKAHEIDAWELRERAGLTTNDSICSPEVSDQRRRENLDHPRGVVLTPARSRGPQRWTTAGISKNRAALSTWVTEDPERHRRMSATAASARTPESAARVREAALAWHRDPQHKEQVRQRGVRNFQTPQAEAKRRAALEIRRQPCGTRAAYRRGCRCDGCVAANREYKRKGTR